MSTQPVPATPSVITKVENTIKSEFSWLQKHERLLIVAMVLIFGYVGINHYLNNAAAKAEIRATVAEAKAATSDDAAVKAASAVAQIQQQYQVLATHDQALIASLAQAAVARQATTVAQQKTDTTLAPSALASRIATLSSAPPAEVTLSGDSINLGRNAAVAVAQTLELVPELRADLKDETSIATATQAQLTSANGVIAAQGIQITALNIARTADAGACKADLAQVKSDAHKQNMTWFKRGLKIGGVGGFIAGLYFHALGL